MTFITHGFRVSAVSDVRKTVRDLGSPLRFMLRRCSLVECVSVLVYVQPCLSKNPKYTFYTRIKSSLTLAYYVAFWSCDTVRKLMRQTTQKVYKH
jgi:hypothetical protein